MQGRWNARSAFYWTGSRGLLARSRARVASFLEETIDPFGRIAASERGHNDLREHSLAMVHLRNTRDAVDHRVNGGRRIGGDGGRQLQCIVKADAVVHQVITQSHLQALLGVVSASRQHHLDHAAGANDAGNAHRAAADDEDATLAFRQLKGRRALHHAHLAGRG